jgi:site-specific recombinase XerD
MNVETDSGMTDFVQYLEVEKNASPHTINNYVMDINQFIQHIWGDHAQAPFDWAGIDRMQARSFLIVFQQAGCKPSTTSRKLSSLRSFFKYLQREERIVKNPFSGLPLPKREKYLPQIFSIEEATSLLEAPEKMNADKALKHRGTDLWRNYMVARDAAILELLYSTGIRISELTGLRESNADLISGVIIVHGKGKKQRICPVGTPANRALHQCLDQRETAQGHFSEQGWQSHQQSLDRTDDEKIPDLLRIKRGFITAYPAPQLRHTSARCRGRSAECPGAPGPCEPIHHANLYACIHRTAERGLRPGASARVRIETIFRNNIYIPLQAFTNPR